MTRSPVTPAWRSAQALLALAIVAAVAHACWRLFGDIGYRIDADVYRMGARAWLDHRPLYADGALFETQAGLELPFTYPPLAAVAFSPLALVPLPVAGVAITAVTLLLLVVSVWIVLTRLQVAENTALLPGAPWARRGWLAAGIVAVSVTTLEPIRANFSFGQINVVLMTLVIADCVPRRTPWPRGVLLGVAIALKLTPAVFLLYLVLRRDGRAVAWALGTFAAATAAGFVLAWRDSWQYWTETVHDTSRIGTATWNTNQNVAGALARLNLDETTGFIAWTAICFAVLALTVWAVRRMLAAHEPTLALICVALFGLVVSPVSWSHHWVWSLPAVTVLAVLGWRRRSVVLTALAVGGVALMVWPPLGLLPEHQESSATWWRQLFGMGYVWWALAVIGVGGAVVGDPAALSPQRSPESARPADLPGRA